MKINSKTIIIIVLCLIVAFISFNITKSIYQGKVYKAKRELKNYKIKTDSLTEVADNQYRKLVADTLTKRQLLKKIDSLEIKVENPIVVTEIEYKFKDRETKGKIKQTDTTIQFKDYYPNKSKPFIAYESNLNKIKETFKGGFKFNPVKVDLVFSKNKDGIYQLDSKLPDYIKLNSLDIQSEPLDKDFSNKKTFTTFAGLKYNHTFTDHNPSVEAIIGVRYRKVNLIGSLNTNSYLGIGFLIDF